MKKFFFSILFCLFALNMFAQNKDGEKLNFIEYLADKSQNGNYIYEAVENENFTKEEMYKRAKNWVLSNLKTADNNVNFDEQDFTIINNASVLIAPISVNFVGTISRGVANFKFNLQFKENRYRLIIDNVTIYLEHGIGTNVPPNSFTYNELMKLEGLKAVEKPGKKKFAITLHVMKEVNDQIGAIAANLKSAIENHDPKNDNNW